MAPFTACLLFAALAIRAFGAPIADVPCVISPLFDPNHDKLGAVATESQECSQIAIDLFKQGGNAADALTGAVFCVGVTGMYHSGLGGGGFMLVRASNGSYEFIDFRETAPSKAYEEMYQNNVQASIFGGLARYVSLLYMFRFWSKEKTVH